MQLKESLHLLGVCSYSKWGIRKVLHLKRLIQCGTSSVRPINPSFYIRSEETFFYSFQNFRIFRELSSRETCRQIFSDNISGDFPFSDFLPHVAQAVAKVKQTARPIYSPEEIQALLDNSSAATLKRQQEQRVASHLYRARQRRKLRQQALLAEASHRPFETEDEKQKRIAHFELQTSRAKYFQRMSRTSKTTPSPQASQGTSFSLDLSSSTTIPQVDPKPNSPLAATSTQTRTDEVQSGSAGGSEPSSPAIRSGNAAFGGEPPSPSGRSKEDFLSIPQLPPHVSEAYSGASVLKGKRDHDHEADAEEKKPFDALKHRSSISAETFADLYGRFRIPEGVVITRPHLSDRACHVRNGEYAIYVEQLEAGLRLPLAREIVGMSRVFGVSPGQLVPNAWRQLIAFYVFSREMGWCLDADTLKHIFRASPSTSGYYLISSRSLDCGMFRLLPNKVSNWKKQWIWVKCGPEDTLVHNHWRLPEKGERDAPDEVTEASYNLIRMIQNCFRYSTLEKRISCTLYLKEDRLAALNLAPPLPELCRVPFPFYILAFYCSPLSDNSSFAADPERTEVSLASALQLEMDRAAKAQAAKAIKAEQKKLAKGQGRASTEEKYMSFGKSKGKGKGKDKAEIPAIPEVGEEGVEVSPPKKLKRKRQVEDVGLTSEDYLEVSPAKGARAQRARPDDPLILSDAEMAKLQERMAPKVHSSYDPAVSVGQTVRPDGTSTPYFPFEADPKSLKPDTAFKPNFDLLLSESSTSHWTNAENLLKETIPPLDRQFYQGMLLPHLQNHLSQLLVAGGHALAIYNEKVRDVEAERDNAMLRYNQELALFEESKTRVATAEASASTLRKGAKKLVAKLDQRSQELSTVTKERDELRAEVEGLRSKVSPLEAEVKSLKGDRDASFLRADDLQREVDSFNADFANPLSSSRIGAILTKAMTRVALTAYNLGSNSGGAALSKDGMEAIDAAMKQALAPEGESSSSTSTGSSSSSSSSEGGEAASEEDADQTGADTSRVDRELAGEPVVGPFDGGEQPADD